MSKRYNIKWSENDEKELKRLVKNFNAKITRLNKKDNEVRGYLPQKVSYAQLRDSVQTRSDLNIAKRKLESFTKKGSEKLVSTGKGLTMTKWEKQQGRQTKQRFNKKLRKSATNDNIDYLPNQIELDYAENVKSLEEYRKLMQSVDKFSSAGSTDLLEARKGFKITKWEWEHYKVEESIDNEHKSKELEHLKNARLKSRGKQIADRNPHTRHIAEVNLLPTDRKIENIDRKRWDNARRRMDKVLDADYLQNKQEAYKENYFLAIDRNGLSDEIKEIINELEEYSEGKILTLVEWAEFSQNALPFERIDVTINYIDETQREFVFTAEGNNNEKIIRSL